MIITRTPFRVSLLGGGTDFPSWYEKEGGLVVGGAINKYSYITARYLPPFHKHHSKFVYSQMDLCHHNTSVSNKAIRETLKHVGLGDPDSPGLEVFHAADLPGRSGTGSSSSFVVGLVHALQTLQGRLSLPHELAAAAIEIERVRLGETVGCQDQTFAAHGGLNVIRFAKSGDIQVYPLTLDASHIAELESHMLLFFTKIERISSHVASTYVPTLADKAREQFAMMKLAEDGTEAIYRRDWKRLGELVDKAWRIKAGLSTAVSNDDIDTLYSAARLCGAYGGKITGAGGGGCLLLIADPSKHASIIETLTQLNCVHVPFGFDFDGSRVVYCDKDNLRYRP